MKTPPAQLRSATAWPNPDTFDHAGSYGLGMNIATTRSRSGFRLSGTRRFNLGAATSRLPAAAAILGIVLLSNKRFRCGRARNHRPHLLDLATLGQPPSIISPLINPA